MIFQKEKKEFLAKKDKSRKGSIDAKIKKLVGKINSLDDFFTTSSCSGRILLLAIPKSNKKNEVQYLFRLHKKINNNEFKKLIKIMKSKKIPKEDVWFIVQPVILHIACKDIDNAKKLLNTARDIGFKISGIISIGKSKIILELISTEKIEAIVSKNGKLLIDEDYFKVLVKEGNKKLEKTWKKIEKFYGELCTTI
jgi:tRNA wybutosine-synthesizing protein 3|tara:strand:+ start:1460 stop:2047 length:588 start_codon:yes stop_codon:yes gene_type:complete